MPMSVQLVANLPERGGDAPRDRMRPRRLWFQFILDRGQDLLGEGDMPSTSRDRR